MKLEATDLQFMRALLELIPRIKHYTIDIICISLYIYICVCISIYMYIYICIHICIYICIHIYIYMYIYIHIYVYMLFQCGPQTDPMSRMPDGALSNLPLESAADPVRRGDLAQRSEEGLAGDCISRLRM